MQIPKNYIHITQVHEDDNENSEYDTQEEGCHRDSSSQTPQGIVSASALVSNVLNQVLDCPDTNFENAFENLRKISCSHWDSEGEGIYKRLIVALNQPQLEGKREQLLRQQLAFLQTNSGSAWSERNARYWIAFVLLPAIQKVFGNFADAQEEVFAEGLVYFSTRAHSLKPEYSFSQMQKWAFFCVKHEIHRLIKEGELALTSKPSTTRARRSQSLSTRQVALYEDAIKAHRHVIRLTKGDPERDLCLADIEDIQQLMMDNGGTVRDIEKVSDYMENEMIAQERGEFSYSSEASVKLEDVEEIPDERAYGADEWNLYETTLAAMGAGILFAYGGKQRDADVFEIFSNGIDYEVDKRSLKRRRLLLPSTRQVAACTVGLEKKVSHETVNQILRSARTPEWQSRYYEGVARYNAHETTQFAPFKQAA